MRNLVEHRSCKLNSLAQWHVAKNPLTVCYNFCVMSLCKYMPLLGLKNWVYRNLLGMKVGRGTAISPGTTMDFFFPELIEIGSDTIIGYNTLVLTHEFLIGKWRTGKVIIGDEVMIGANCTILAGVKIGNRAQVGAGSVVSRDIKAGEKYYLAKQGMD